MADKYSGEFFLISVLMSLFFTTDGNADLTLRKRAETFFFSIHFLLIQEVRNKLASLVLLPAQPPKWPLAIILLVSAQKVILLVMSASKILPKHDKSAIG
jgi:hypothetical protein